MIYGAHKHMYKTKHINRKSKEDLLISHNLQVKHHMKIGGIHLEPDFRNFLRIAEVS